MFKYLFLLCLISSISYAGDMYSVSEPVLSMAGANAVNGKLSKYESEIVSNSREIGIDPLLVKAIIHTESKFNSKAVSPKGAYGLMQLMPSTASMYNVDRTVPYDNVKGGLLYLKYLLDKYDIRIALAAYNAGEGAVSKYGGIPPYKETRDYVKKVITRYNFYKGYN